MPVNVVHNTKEEGLWERAKQAAAKQGKAGNYALIMSIFQQMKGGAKKSMVAEEHKEKSMNSVYDEIFAQQLDEELLKADVVDFDGDSHTSKGYDLNDEPRAEMRAKMNKAAEEGGVELANGLDPMKVGGPEGHQPMVDHARPGNSDMDAWYSSNMMKNQGVGGGYSPSMVDHPRPGASVSKADTGGQSSMELHEPSTSSSYQATQTLSRGTYELPEASNHPAAGMPDVDPGQSMMFSEDDRDIGSVMSPGTRPIYASQSVGQGDRGRAGLEADVSEVYGEDVSAGSGGIPGSGESSVAMVDHQRPMAKADPYGERFVRMNAASARGSNDLYHVIDTPASVRQAAPLPGGTQWRQGYVTYSTHEDERIAKCVDADGNVIAEPSLNWQSPLLKSRGCTLCKSSVPSFLTVCPNCGGSEHGHAPTGYGVLLEKSVADSIRGPTQGDMKFPGGSIIIEE